MFGGFQRGPFQPIPAFQQEEDEEVVGGGAPGMILRRRRRDYLPFLLATIKTFLEREG